MKMTKQTEALKDQFRVAGHLEDTKRIFLSEEKFLFDTRLEISIKFKTFLCTIVYFFCSFGKNVLLFSWTVDCSVKNLVELSLERL